MLIAKAVARLRGRYEDWMEGSLDRKYGIETAGIHDDIAALGASGRNLGEAVRYEPIEVLKFHRMIRAADIEPREFSFVDYGCGKGRAVVLAAECGFKRVVGVEFAAALHALAQRNVEVFARKRRRSPPIELCHGDAAELPIPEGDVLLFLYNPFGAGVMREVAANVERSWRARARRIVVLYANPWHAHAWDELGFLRQRQNNKSFALYVSGPRTE